MVLFVALGCALPSVAPEGRAAVGAEAAEPLRDLQAAVTEWEALADRVGAWTDAERAPAAAAVTELATNCPYNRATFMVLLTLDRELAQLDPAPLSAGERARLALVARGVAAQVRVLRALGGDELPRPMLGEYLAGDLAAGPPPLPVGSAFSASLDPIADTEGVVAQVQGLVQWMPGSTHDRVERAWATLGAAGVESDAWFGAVGQWSTALSELWGPLSGGREGRGIRLERLLRSHGGQGC